MPNKTYPEELNLLKWVELQFIINMLSATEFPSYPGSIFRGALCTTFRRLVCIQRGKLCPDCLLNSKCSYNLLFEKPIHQDEPQIGGETRSTTNAFIIEPPILTRSKIKANQKLKLQLVLIGNSIDYLPFFLLTVQKMGLNGITPHRTKFQIMQVNSLKKCGRLIPINADQNMQIYHQPVVITASDFFKRTPKCSQIAIDFLTPTRLVKDGKVQSTITFELLMRSILRRINQLLIHYCNIPQPLNFINLVEQAQSIQIVNADLKPWHWERYSYRQKQTINMDGLVGTAQFTGDILPFLPYLKIAEHLHIGKHTVFGMGKIKVKILA